MPKVSRSKTKKQSSIPPQTAAGSKQKHGAGSLQLLPTTFTKDATWKVTFLPSLSHSFYVSHEPLKHFKRASDELLTLIQAVFDLSFPHVRYQVTKGDTILITVCLLDVFMTHSNPPGQAYSRIKTKRSLISADALKAVTHFFTAKEYVGKPALIKEYARWALRGDGPAYNLYPTPSECTVPPTDSAYIVRCSLKSHFQSPHRVFERPSRGSLDGAWMVDIDHVLLKT